MRTLLATLIAIAALLLVSALRGRGAPVVPASGAESEFSAERARAAFMTLDAQAPHATGTAALSVVRARIAAQLRALGLPPEERSAIACGRYGTCARVNRLLARIPGTRSTGVVLVVAHSDAVGASPGASDDGAGVAAILEIARALRHGPALANDVWLLVVEGEELGLLGAEAFVEEPLAHAASVVINLEARGTSGGATLFQTSRGSGFLIDVAARAAERPNGSSLYAAIYERMPNDTDLSVFLARGYAGLNYAFTGGVEGYHTSRDDLEHQDPRSLQHLGQSALSSVRALAARDLGAMPRYELIWFDVLGLTIVRFPAGLALPLGAVTAALLVLLAAIALGRRRVRGAQLAASFAALALALAVAALLGVAVHHAARAEVPWVARPAAHLFALTAAALVALLAPIAALHRRVNVEAHALATALVHAALGVVVAVALRGGAYLLLVPGAAAAIALALATLLPTRVNREVATAVPALVAAVVWAPIIAGLYPNLGLMVAPAIPVVIVVALSWVAPLATSLPRVILGRGAALLALFGVVATVVAATSPTFSSRVPQRANVIVAVDENARSVVAIDASWGGASWGAPPAAMVAALGPALRREPVVPFRDDRLPLADGAPVPLSPPEARLVESAGPLGGNQYRARLRLRSVRGAPVVLLVAPPGSNLLSVDVVGEGGPIRAQMFERGLARGARAVRFDGLPDVEVVCTFAGPPTALTLADMSYGVPDPMRAIVAARPPEAVASQDGDVTIVHRAVRPW